MIACVLLALAMASLLGCAGGQAETSLIAQLNSALSNATLHGQHLVEGVYDTDSVRNLASTFKTAMGEERTAELVDRLAVVVPFFLDPAAYRTPRGLRRWANLECNLPRWKEQLGATGPVDILLFLHSDGSVLEESAEALRNVAIVITALAPSLQLPSAVSADAPWTYRTQHTLEDLITARWRLTFALPFLRESGYRYALFATEDSLLTKPYSGNLVEKMRQRGAGIAVRAKRKAVPNGELRGLEDLARLWMASRGLPGPMGAKPRSVGPGPHLEPLARLYLTHFWAVDLSFWFHPLVQDLVLFLLRRHVDIEGAHTDEGLVNLVAHVLLPPKHVLEMDCGVLHSAPPPPLVRHFGCASDRALVAFEQAWLAVVPNRTEAQQRWQRTSVVQYSATAVVQPLLLDAHMPQDALFFEWLCADYEDLLGSCSAPANAERSLHAYMAAFCLRHAMSPVGCRSVSRVLAGRWPLFSLDGSKAWPESVAG